MNGCKTIALIGQDARQQAVGRALADLGYQMLGAEGCGAADCLLFPLPMEETLPGLAGMLAAAKPGALVLGGRVSARAKGLAMAAGVELVDYYQRPELIEWNAIPTAEGCIALLMQHSAETLWGRSVLVVGFGRVGRAVAVRLRGLGARVTVAARDGAQRALAENLGCRAITIRQMAQQMACFTAVVNTVPALLLTRPLLEALPPRSLIVDLASRPGGTDFTAAETLGHTALHALGLPGRCAPETAGRFIAGAVHQILQERGEQV